jgi:hypothetical protein
MTLSTEAANAKESLLTKTPKMKPIVATSSVTTTSGRPSQLLLAEELNNSGEADIADDDPFTGQIDSPRFPGRLSAVLPRHADPILKEEATEGSNGDEELDLISQLAPEEAGDTPGPGDAAKSLYSILEGNRQINDVNSLRESAIEAKIMHNFVGSEDHPNGVTPATKKKSMFQLRSDVLDSYRDSMSDFESEDDLSPLKELPVQRTSSRRKSTNRHDAVYATQRHSRRSTLGLTALAEQFGAWTSVSPTKPGTDCSAIADSKNTHNDNISPSTQASGVNLDSSSSPIKSTFFEDEIQVHADSEDFHQQVQSEVGNDAIGMEDVDMANEDMVIAVEASGISLLHQHTESSHETRRVDEVLSEASQEYGDENELPLDPALTARRHLAPVTPLRSVKQVSYFTTTKVPLKPADDSESSPSKKRSFSASRVSAKASGNLSRSATVISYSPTKDRKRASILPANDPFSTPARGDIWSSVDTPARTPRRDVDPELLRGAVVFVDVHTTEGADASGIFVELLNQMGAKCVKTWHWNPSGSLNSDSSSSKVGITHVVFKDGGKRTMEKVRETGGIVHCVGVSWVLE